MYVRSATLGAGWWGLAPAPVARAIAVGACAYASGGAGTTACAQAANATIKDKKKVVQEPAVQPSQQTNLLANISNTQLLTGGAVGVLLLALLSR